MIGIMQGRLSPMVGKKIQAFPKKHWKAEFFTAQALGFELIEWTLDRHDLLDNPLFLHYELIETLADISGVKVKSITYDAAMQAPLVVNGEIQKVEVELLIKVLFACKRLKIKYLIFPLVDQSSVNAKDLKSYLTIFRYLNKTFLDDNLQIAIESDFPPSKLSRFITAVGSPRIRINYDTGNSASLGYEFIEEMAEYSHLISNIHLKDRELGGPTVPFGQGNAPLIEQISYFQKNLSDCNLIIQGARSEHGADIYAAHTYLKFVTSVEV